MFRKREFIEEHRRSWLYIVLSPTRSHKYIYIHRLKPRAHYFRFRSARANFSAADALMHGFANRRAYIYTHSHFLSRLSRTQQTILLFPFYGRRLLHLPCRYRRETMGRDVIFKSFCVGAFAWHPPLSRCLCPTGFAASLRPPLSRKNLTPARVVLRSRPGSPAESARHADRIMARKM